MAPCRQHPAFYLAIPPALFPTVIHGLGAAGLARGARVIVEKPFGRDLTSPRALNLVALEVVVAEGRVPVDTFGGRAHVEWDPAAAVTPLGPLPFFAEFLQVSGLFDPWVEQCPLRWISPNAPRTPDVLGTAVLGILSGHQRYAHLGALRGDTVNPPLFGMEKVVSENAVRRAWHKIDEKEGRRWLQTHLDAITEPLLREPWILDTDVTVKPLDGHQEGAVKDFMPMPRFCATGRPSSPAPLR